jgi:phosphomannomutase
MKSFKNARVYVDGQGTIKTDLLFDERIVKIGICESEGEEIPLPDDAVVLPGFIDQHIHGAGGSDGMDGTVEDIDCATCNAILYDLEDGSYICLRPSGTEPKLRKYYSIKGTSNEDADKKFEVIMGAFDEILANMK